MTMAVSDLSKTFIREWENSQEQILKIHQLEVGDVGCVVWDAALVLSAYLSTESFSKLLHQCLSCRSKSDNPDVKMIELGSGTGIVGIQAATLDKGYSVTITDLPELVPLMEKNADTNKSLFRGQVAVQSLTWGVDDIHQKYDVILMADCIYYEDSLSPLVQTLDKLAHDRTLILCCYEARTEGKNPETERKFFSLARERFEIEEIPIEDQDPDYRSPEIHILRFIRIKS